MSSKPDTQKKQTQKPEDSIEQGFVTVVEFQKTRASLQNLSFISIFLAIFNIVLVFVVAWVVGSQLNSVEIKGLDERLLLVEDKLDQVISILPPDLRPKVGVTVTPPDKTLDRWKGNKDNRYVLVKYSDLRCPGCVVMHPEIKAFIENNSSEVSLVFRNFPVTSGNPNSLRLAKTAECVAKYNGEGAFWNFVEGIYSQTIDETVEGEEALSKFVENPSKIAECVKNGETDQKIERDLEDARQASIRATPTLVFYDTQTDKVSFVRNLGTAEHLQQLFNEFKTKQKK